MNKTTPPAGAYVAVDLPGSVADAWGKRVIVRMADVMSAYARFPVTVRINHPTQYHAGLSVLGSSGEDLNALDAALFPPKPREDGFYWARIYAGQIAEATEVVEFRGGLWLRTGVESVVQAEEVEVLGDRLEEPDE